MHTTFKKIKIGGAEGLEERRSYVMEGKNTNARYSFC